jgi:hypothetical protein
MRDRKSSPAVGPIGAMLAGPIFHACTSLRDLPFGPGERAHAAQEKQIMKKEQDSKEPIPVLGAGDIWGVSQRYRRSVRTIDGNFDITDDMGVGAYSLALEPSGSVNVTVDPGSTSTHVFGTWTVDTTGLPPCGYVAHLTAYDRTIVDLQVTFRSGAGRVA